LENKAEHIDHKEIFPIEIKPSRLNPEGKEIADETFWEERINCIYEKTTN
jgi:hypothetical protein